MRFFIHNPCTGAQHSKRLNMSYIVIQAVYVAPTVRRDTSNMSCNTILAVYVAVN